MKKISTLLCTIFLSLSLLAYDGSRLSISTISNTMNLKIEIDGYRQNIPDNMVTFSNIGEGYHQVKIFREKRNGFRNNNINGDGSAFGRRADIIYNSSVYLRRGIGLDIIISRSGKVFTDESPIDRNDGFYNNDGSNDNYYDNNNGGGWNNGYVNVISTNDFELVKEQIRKEWFENKRLNLTKSIIDNNNFTALQAKELVSVFSFENNKLEVAKYAYGKTVDKKNYYVINDAFTFNSSKEELTRYILEIR